MNERSKLDRLKVAGNDRLWVIAYVAAAGGLAAARRLFTTLKSIRTDRESRQLFRVMR